MKSIRQLSVVLLVIILIITACSSNIITLDTESTIKDCIQLLSSDEYAGRLAGTDGNKKVERLIAAVFDQIGLDYLLDQSYFLEYNQQQLYVDSKEAYMTIYQDGKVIERCDYGTEFMEQYMLNNVNIEGNIVFDADNADIADSVLVAEDSESITRLSNKSKAVLVLKKSFKKNLIASISSSSEEYTPIIQINEEIYNKIKSNDNLSIRLSLKVKQQEILPSNVVGVIRGKENNKAVVISSHFDHVGKAGRSMYAGALDNASGIAVMMDLAKKLKQYSDTHKLDRDIIFCAFNSQEAGLVGSKAFVSKIRYFYDELYNINIEEVGAKASKDIYISSSEIGSSSLSNSMLEFLKARAYSCQLTTELISDHASFTERLFPAISIYNTDTDIIHTPDDTIDKLDITFIEDLSQALYEYIINNQYNDYKWSYND